MARAPVPEAKLVEIEGRVKPASDGWFVINVADSVSMGIDDSQYGFHFEGAPRAFPHFGVNVTVLGPGKPAAMYHAEAGQEAFLVLEGECMLIVEDQERRLRKWDFVHCPPYTAHVIVGDGDAPCALLMIGARNAGTDLIYPASQVAAKYGASVNDDTEDRSKAYAGWPPLQRQRYPWPPARTR